MKWLSGWKTYASAALAALVAANEVLGWISPERQATIIAVAAALGLAGLRHAIARIEEKR